MTNEIKVRAGSIRITVGHRYIGLGGPPGVDLIAHLTEEIGIGRLLGKVIAEEGATVIDRQLVGSCGAKRGDGFPVWKKENGCSKITAAIDLRIDEKGQPVVELVEQTGREDKAFIKAIVLEAAFVGICRVDPQQYIPRRVQRGVEVSADPGKAKIAARIRYFTTEIT